jgi:hypothetical protein
VTATGGVPWVTTGRKRVGRLARDQVNLGHRQAGALCWALHGAMKAREVPGCKWFRPVQRESDFVGVEIRYKVHQRSDEDGNDQSIASANVAACQEQKDRQRVNRSVVLNVFFIALSSMLAVGGKLFQIP